jgi:hypothetical protein
VDEDDDAVILRYGNFWQGAGPATTLSGGLHVTLPPLPLAAWPATADGDGRRSSTPNVPPRHGTASSCRHSLRRHVARVA